jgi:hypothetical protein
VRMLGIAVANLVPYVPQRELFIDNDKLQSLEKAEDAVLNRFGEFSLKPAALLQLSRAGREAGKWSFTPPSPTPRSSAGGRRFIVTR